jgi:exosome complex exonuclease RRP6
MQNLFDSLLDLTARSNFLKPSEVAFHESTNPQFRESIQRQKAKVDALILEILDHLEENQDKKPRDVQYQEISDVVDACLEKADVQMDIVSGKIKKQIKVQEPAKIVKHATQLSKPQLKFKDEIDNFNSPFVPKLRSKPNARRPLDFGHPESKDISDDMVEHLKSIHRMNIGHPYEYEITNISYPSRMLCIAPEILYEVLLNFNF